MSKTSDLANQYSALTDQLDDLFNSLTTIGHDADATEVKNAEDAIAQAVNDLAGLDAIDRLTDPNDQAVLANLTATMNAQNDQISKQEAKVAAVVSFTTSLVNVVGRFRTGNVVGAVQSAATALTQLRALTGG
jgi:hypothetical protein